MDIQRGFAPANGTELYYEVAGSGSPVVLLHPGQGGLVMWDPQFEEFARTHRVIRYDARGFGRSEKPLVAYTNHEDLRSILDALGVRRAGLVGLSLGGRTMLDFVLTYPDRVACLVLANPGISGYQFVHLEAFMAQIRAANEREDLDAYVEINQRMWVDGQRSPDQIDARIRADTARIFREQTERNKARFARLGGAAKVSELDAASRLAEIRAPTLIIESTLDQPDIHEICDKLAREIAGARRLRVDGAAHLVNLERPREFAAAVLPFLAAHPGA